MSILETLNVQWRSEDRSGIHIRLTNGYSQTARSVQTKFNRMIAMLVGDWASPYATTHTLPSAPVVNPDRMSLNLPNPGADCFGSGVNVMWPLGAIRPTVGSGISPWVPKNGLGSATNDRLWPGPEVMFPRATVRSGPARGGISHRAGSVNPKDRVGGLAVHDARRQNPGIAVGARRDRNGLRGTPWFSPTGCGVILPDVVTLSRTVFVVVLRARNHSRPFLPCAIPPTEPMLAGSGYVVT